MGHTEHGADGARSERPPHIAALGAPRRVPSLMAMRERTKAAAKAPKTILIVVARQFLVTPDAITRNRQPIRL